MLHHPLHQMLRLLIRKSQIPEIAFSSAQIGSKRGVSEMGKRRPKCGAASIVPLSAFPFWSSFPHTHLKERKCHLAGAQIFARHRYLPGCRLNLAQDKHSSRHHRTGHTHCSVTEGPLTAANFFQRHDTQRKRNTAIPSQTLRSWNISQNLPLSKCQRFPLLRCLPRPSLPKIEVAGLNGISFTTPLGKTQKGTVD